MEASDLRALIARARVPVYRVAARVGLHPSTLSLFLNGRRPLTEALARAVVEAVEELSGESSRTGGGDHA